MSCFCSTTRIISLTSAFIYCDQVILNMEHLYRACLLHLQQQSPRQHAGAQCWPGIGGAVSAFRTQERHLRMLLEDWQSDFSFCDQIVMAWILPFHFPIALMWGYICKTLTDLQNGTWNFKQKTHTNLAVPIFCTICSSNPLVSGRPT